MKYERLHGPVFICRGCGTRGRWLWWWNRRNGMNAKFVRMCASCGRKSGYKFIGYDVNKVKLGMEQRCFYLKNKNRENNLLIYKGPMTWRRKNV